MTQRTVLITGCSQGGIGSALAIAFHSRGCRVIATARSLDKMSHLAELGIHTILLDVTSSTSIAECVDSVSTLTGNTLDILINNAGYGLTMPITDTPVAAAQQMFNTNFFGALAVIQAFIPLLLSSSTTTTTTTTTRPHRPMIVNNTSVVSVLPFPFQGVYNASKAALASLTDTLRLELGPFDIDVVDLKTGVVHTRFFDNVRNTTTTDQDSSSSSSSKEPRPSRRSPPSIYAPASRAVSQVTSRTTTEETAMSARTYAEKVVGDLSPSSARSPPVQIWRGSHASTIWFARRFLPFTGLDGNMRQMGNLSEVEREIRKGERERENDVQK